MSEKRQDQDLASGNEKPLSEGDKEVVWELIQIQKNELQIKREEFDLRKQEFIYRDKDLERDSKLSEQAIKASVEDSRSNREHKREITKLVLTFSTFVVLILAIVAVMAFHSGNAEIVMEAVKAIVTLGIGAVGGYSFGFKKGEDSLIQKLSEAEDTGDNSA